ncbi:MAG: hydroxyethylthiazole kinase [Pseudomonadota bacterium]|jgi:hydroxyethylthiazole kinase
MTSRSIPDARALWSDVESVRAQAPLVHSVTNFVVTQFNANVLLATGASPVMAHAIEEVADMASIASAVVVNIGTLDSHWVPSMRLALETAHRLGKPSVLDPVGAGATRYRNEVLAMLVRERPVLIRGNASEIMSLAGAAGATKGVDSTASTDAALDSARALCRDLGAVVCVSGAEDHVIAPDGRWVSLANGHPWMTRVTGVGCSATALIGAFAGVQPDPWRACVSAMAFWGVVGERAAQAVQAHGGGFGSYAEALLDWTGVLNESDFVSTLRMVHR